MHRCLWKEAHIEHEQRIYILLPWTMKLHPHQDFTNSLKILVFKIKQAVNVNMGVQICEIVQNCGVTITVASNLLPMHTADVLEPNFSHSETLKEIASFHCCSVLRWMNIHSDEWVISFQDLLDQGKLYYQLNYCSATAFIRKAIELQQVIWSIYKWRNLIPY